VSYNNPQAIAERGAESLKLRLRPPWKYRTHGKEDLVWKPTVNGSSLALDHCRKHSDEFE